MKQNPLLLYHWNHGSQLQVNQQGDPPVELEEQRRLLVRQYRLELRHPQQALRDERLVSSRLSLNEDLGLHNRSWCRNSGRTPG